MYSIQSVVIVRFYNWRILGPVVSYNMQRIPERSSIQVLQVSEGGGGYLGQKIGRFVAFFNLNAAEQEKMVICALCI